MNRLALLDSEETVLRDETKRLWQHRAGLMVRELGRYCVLYENNRAETRARQVKLLNYVDDLEDGAALKEFCGLLKRWYALHGLRMPLPETLEKLTEADEI